MRKLTVIIAIVSMLAFSTIVMAETNKLGVFNPTRCFAESDAGKAANKELEDLEKDYSNRLQPLQTQLSKMDQDFKEQMKVLSQSEQETRYLALQKKLNEYQTLATQYAESIDQRSSELFDQILIEVMAVIKTVGDRGKFTMVVDSTAIIYGPNLADITDDVIAEYNKVYKAKK